MQLSRNQGAEFVVEDVRNRQTGTVRKKVNQALFLGEHPVLGLLEERVGTSLRIEGRNPSRVRQVGMGIELDRRPRQQALPVGMSFGKGHPLAHGQVLAFQALLGQTEHQSREGHS